MTNPTARTVRARRDTCCACTRHSDILVVTTFGIEADLVPKGPMRLFYISAMPQAQVGICAYRRTTLSAVDDEPDHSEKMHICSLQYPRKPHGNCRQQIGARGGRGGGGSAVRAVQRWPWTRANALVIVH